MFTAFRIAAAFTLVAMGTAAAAHPALVSSLPAANTTVAPTATIELHFSEKLEAAFSGGTLQMTSMPGMTNHAPMKMSGLTTKVGADGKTLVITTKAPMPAGGYTLDWHAVAADTHRVEGSFSFTVK
jgi:hypothetical protein